MPSNPSHVSEPEVSPWATRLKDTNSNHSYTFEELKGAKGTLVVFLANDCPFVRHALDEILRIANDYRVHGIGFIGVNSNDPVLSATDGAAQMTEFAFRNKIDFAYLSDSAQQAARSVGLETTPDFYLFDPNDKLFYHGQLDDSRPGNNIPVSGTDLRQAIDALIYNRSMASPQKPAQGSRIISNR